MSKVAYRDTNRQTIIYSYTLKDSDQGTAFYCRNKNCNARMFSRRLQNGHFCFYASRSAGHVQGCPFTRDGMIIRTNCSDVDYYAVFEALLKPSVSDYSNNHKDYVHNGTESVEKGKMRTLNQLYRLLKQSDPEERISDKCVKEVLLDDRSDKSFGEIKGKIIVEAEKDKWLYRNDEAVHELYLHHNVKNSRKKYDFDVSFDDEKLYKKYRHEIYNMDNPKIVIAGDWERRGSRYFTRIHSRKQLLIHK